MIWYKGANCFQHTPQLGSARCQSVFVFVFESVFVFEFVFVFVFEFAFVFSFVFTFVFVFVFVFVSRSTHFSSAVINPQGAPWMPGFNVLSITLQQEVHSSILLQFVHRWKNDSSKELWKLWWPEVQLCCSKCHEGCLTNWFLAAFWSKLDSFIFQIDSRIF